MDGLRAERDDVVTSAKIAADDAMGRRKETTVAASRNVKQPLVAGTPKSAKDNAAKGRFSVAYLVLVIMVAALAGWGLYEQAQEIGELKAESREAVELIKQSKLLMARFEGQLLEADAAQVQTGTEVDKQLRFLDSEMRKLWAVSNDRNKKAIAENKEELAVLSKSVDGLKVALEGTGKTLAAFESRHEQGVKREAELAAQLNVAQKELAGVVASLAKLEAGVADLVSQAKQATEQLAVVKSGQAALQKQVSAVDLGPKVRDIEKTIESVDASRLQVNQRLVSLEKRVNDVQLELSTINVQKK